MVNKDVRVGVIRPVTDADIVCGIESPKSNSHVGYSECAHLIELMLQNREHLSSYHKSQGVALLQVLKMSLQNQMMTLDKLHYRST